MKTLVIPQKAVYAGSLILVNGKYPYQEGIAGCSLIPVNADSNKVLLERRTAVLLSRLMNDLDGWTQISAVSGWRSKREQQEIYSRSLRENGAAFTEQFVARPGHSEHQTGLAIDLGLKKPDIDFIRPDFPYCGICQTFREKALPYGFIERYPQGKETVTGIAQEPWHFRYVGAPHAAIMAELGLTLEEYHIFLKQYPCGKECFNYRNGHRNIAVSYVKATVGADTELEIDADVPYSLSGNNIDGFVLTEWRNDDDKR
ncbi:M15 family metallopeptidase [Desulfoscipio sp. XC116]|uniref:M15 family metallopeptidase n=1 Tax=Desulfoscipio sp. XC116 TaxID=3144975 RepID=UPI00325AE35D